jgi:hypothetical protein
MRTEASPRRTAPAASRAVEVVSALVIAAGFVLTVLGILQTGGVAALGVGLLLVFAGSVPLIIDADRRQGAFDDELRRLLDDET